MSEGISKVAIWLKYFQSDVNHKNTNPIQLSHVTYFRKKEIRCFLDAEYLLHIYILIGLISYYYLFQEYFVHISTNKVVYGFANIC